jgi:hypothetical protein
MDKQIYSRRDISELIYSEYFDSSPNPEMKKILQRCVIAFIKMREEEFIDYVNDHAPFVLERLRKNTYYLR